jgi:hypothetical protein
MAAGVFAPDATGACPVIPFLRSLRRRPKRCAAGSPVRSPPGAASAPSILRLAPALLDTRHRLGMGSRQRIGNRSRPEGRADVRRRANRDAEVHRSGPGSLRRMGKSRGGPGRGDAGASDVEPGSGCMASPRQGASLPGLPRGPAGGMGDGPQRTSVIRRAGGAWLRPSILMRPCRPSSWHVHRPAACRSPGPGPRVP